MEITGWLVMFVGLTSLSPQINYALQWINHSLRISIINKPLLPEWPSFGAVVPVVLLGILWVAMAKAIRASIDNEK